MTDTLVAGTRLAERYEIEDVIGRGRSPVYRARDTRLGRAVAVKEVGLVAAAADDPASADRSRALREARAAARVHAPGVVQVYDVVEEHTAVWLVMELVRAPSLQRRVAEQGPMDEVTAARLGLGLLDALDAAHAQGVVHRDVRPANVLVADPDDPTVEVPVRLADFGLAALRDDTALAAPGALSGSPAFTAPEQVTGGPSGPATDLWALGAVLYFAVEGTAPFAGDSPAAVSAAVVAGDVRPAERAGRLARIAEMLLATDPARRPGAPRVRAALRAVATGSEPGDDTQEAPAAGAAAPAPAIAAVPTAATAAPGAVGDRTPPAGSPGANAPAGAPGALDP
ncbi:MAG TPA: serine/threonine-protein kinase, partial [Acidimicrobiales bacterium]